MAKKEKIICPECGGSKIIRKGKRKNKFELVQKYRCKGCGRNFSLTDLKYKTYPGRVIMRAVSLFNLGYSMGKAIRLTNKWYKVKLRRSTVVSWIGEFKEVCTYKRIRKDGLKLFGPNKIIFKKVFFHQQPIIFNITELRLSFSLIKSSFPLDGIWRVLVRIVLMAYLCPVKQGVRG